MKKLSIVLLCVLLAFSFVSCEKDKSEDMVTTYENFCAGWRDADETYDLFYTALEAASEDINIDLAATSTAVKGVSNYVKDYLGNENITVDNSETVKFTEGKITGTKNTTSASLTFKDAKFKVSYHENAKGWASTTTLEFLINGTYEYSLDEEAKTESFAYNFTVNEKTYNVSYTENSETNRYISAKVNGKDVEVRLLNAIYDFAR